MSETKANLKDIEANITKDSIGFPKIKLGQNNLQTNDFAGLGMA